MTDPTRVSEVRTRLELLESDLLTLLPLVVKQNKPVLEGEVRAASVILRRWLCEAELGRLCNQLGVKPTFPVMTNDEIVRQLATLDDIEYYLAAGVAFNGQPVSNIYSSTQPIGSAPRLDVASASFTRVSTKAFLGQKRLYFEGRMFSCQEIITFTANKLGGVHIDFSLRPDQAVLDRAARFMTFGGPPLQAERGDPGQMHLELEPLSREIMSGLHIEIIAAGASLLQVQFDGRPFISVGRKTGLLNRLRKLSGLERHRFKARLHER